MGKVRAVVYWPDSDQVSVENLELIYVEDRYVNAVTTVKTKDNRVHKAIIKLISSDDSKLEAEADSVSLEIDERLKLRAQEVSEAEKKGRKARQRRQTPTGAATVNQVASAMGQRQKPPSHLSDKTKKLAQERKAADAAFHEAQADVDAQILKEAGPKRQLFGNDVILPGSDEEAASSDGDNDAKVEDGIDEESDKGEVSESCSSCQELKTALNKSPAVFIKALGKFANVANPGIQYIDLLPIPNNIPKCELSKGHGVFISVADKNEIKQHGGGDPKKMTRMGLLALYGREVLEKNEVTALGTKQGTKGIRSKERDALKSFVNRNVGKTFDSLNTACFNKVINRKKSQVHRSKAPPRKNSQSSGNKKSQRKSPVKSPLMSPLRALQDRRSPPKTHVVASPTKSIPLWDLSPVPPGPNQGLHQVNSQASTSLQCQPDTSQQSSCYNSYNNSGYMLPRDSNFSHQSSSCGPNWYDNLAAAPIYGRASY